MDNSRHKHLKVGDIIQVHACKADGAIYRSWEAAIEVLSTDWIITVAPAGSLVADVPRGNHRIAHHLRCYYWLDKFYNLIEVFDISGTLVEIYINIASPPEFKDGEMYFKDHELDVSRYPPAEAQLIDEDEFAEAAIRYQYSEEFQQKVYSVARDAMELANHWNPGIAPEFGGDYAQK